MLSKYGLKLGEPYIKHIEGAIWELRPQKNRIFFANIDGNEFIILSIFKKATRKTPQNEMDKAKRMLDRYMRGENNE